MVKYTVATLPLSWAAFGRVSLIGVFANIAVEPLFPVAFVLSLLTSAAGLAWEPAGWAAGLAAYYPLTFITWIGTQAARVRGGALDLGQPGADEVIALYLALAAIGAAAYLRFAPRVRPVRPGVVQVI